MFPKTPPKPLKTPSSNLPGKEDKRYYHCIDLKHVVVIPNEVIEKAGLRGGDELEAEASKGKIVLKKK